MLRPLALLVMEPDHMIVGWRVRGDNLGKVWYAVLLLGDSFLDVALLVAKHHYPLHHDGTHQWLAGRFVWVRNRTLRQAVPSFQCQDYALAVVVSWPRHTW